MKAIVKYFVFRRLITDGNHHFCISGILLAAILILITWRFLTVFNVSVYLGSILKVIKLMTLETMKFMVVFFVAFLALFFAANTLAAGHPINDSTDFWEGMLYSLAVYMGIEEFTGSSDRPLVEVFFVVVTIFGSSLSLFLLFVS